MSSGTSPILLGLAASLMLLGFVGIVVVAVRRIKQSWLRRRMRRARPPDKIYATASNSNICTSHIIRFDKIEEVVTNKVKEYINLYLDEENVASKLQIESENKNKINQIKNELNNIDRQLNNNTLALKNLYMDKVKSIITEEEFIELKNSFSEEKDSLLKKKEQIENVLKEVNNKNNDINEWIKIVKQYKDFKELNHMIVNQLIDFIEIGEKDKTTKEQKIKIHWKF
jgi:K+/H+ antiporter YhaU regulatory subunit KhtT